ncbi:forkhead box protein O4 [Discoglossus pictus]
MEGTEPVPLDIDPDFEPQPRARSCTWPLPRPDLSVAQQQPASAEETRADATDVPSLLPQEGEDRPLVDGLAGAGSVTPRKGGSRRNAWGNQSYAELISQAIESSPEKRLTLSQIYDWMVKTIPFFKDKGDSNSSAGWKNSIRHNLSLHSKFIKVHNEATGKSSWWMLNPDGGKSGKAPRRRAASMDNSSSKLIKARSKLPKKKPPGPGEPPAGSPGSQPPKWPGSPSSRSSDDPDPWTSFRPRSGSNASSARLSPILPEQDDLVDEEHLPSMGFSSSVPPTVTEELELIDGLTLLSSGSSLLPSHPSLLPGASTFSLRPTQPTTFGNSLFSPLERSPVRGSSAQYSRPQTLEALLTSDSPPPSNVMMTQVDPVLTQSGAQNLFLLGGQNKSRNPEQTTLSLSSLMPSATLSVLGLPQNSSASCPKLASFAGASEKLPTDLDMDMILENLECDMDYIIKHELMDEGGLDFNFEPSYPGTNQGNNHSWVPS